MQNLNVETTHYNVYITGTNGHSTNKSIYTHNYDGEVYKITETLYGKGDEITYTATCNGYSSSCQVIGLDNQKQISVTASFKRGTSSNKKTVGWLYLKRYENDVLTSFGSTLFKRATSYKTSQNGSNTAKNCSSSSSTYCTVTISSTTIYTTLYNVHLYPIFNSTSMLQWEYELIETNKGTVTTTSGA